MSAFLTRETPSLFSEPDYFAGGFCEANKNSVVMYARRAVSVFGSGPVIESPGATSFRLLGRIGVTELRIFQGQGGTRLP